MRSILSKSNLRNISHSLGRYLSLIAVSFLGAGILAGLLAIAPDMANTADQYLQSQHVADVMIQSPLGFSTEDVTKIKEQSFIENIQEVTTFDTIAAIAGNSYTMRIHSVPNQAVNMNQLKLIKGHLPKKAGEAVIVTPPDGIKNIHLSDEVKLSAEDSSAYTKTDHLKIVGIIKSGLYPHNKQGTSSKGDGTVDFVLFAAPDSFNDHVENTIYANFKNNAGIDRFSTEYEDKVNANIKKIQQFSTDLANDRFNSLKAEIDEGETKVVAAQKQLEQQKALTGNYNLPAIQEMTKKLDDTANQLAFQRKNLQKVEKPQWYFEARNESQGFAIIKADAQSMKSLATIFPIIFFLVAALVSLTSMTRMIDDERILIGTLKSLGYSDGKIASRYLGYSISSTLIGSVLGVYAGFKVLPAIVWFAYSTQYSLPEIDLAFHGNYASLAILLMLVLTTVVTGWTIFNVLKESAAELMVPKAPQPGKRIFLERIGFVWQRLSFSQKVTQRNIFLDKKRMLMTVIGVIGSTALLVTGFGLQNSANEFPKEQYQQITKYQATATFDETGKLSPELTNTLENPSLINNFLPVRGDSVEVSSKKPETKKYTIAMITTEKMSALNDFVKMENQEKSVKVKGNGVVLTKNIAERLKLTVGDYFEAKLLGDYTSEKLKVTGIVDNYHLNYIYLGKNYYEKVFDKPLIFNQALLKTKKQASENQISSSLKKNPSISNVSFTRTTMNRLQENMKSIDMVVIILIVLASMLAIVVLYNVTNINIEERQREIATLKVLGFTDLETDVYVFRETIQLTLMGTLIGLAAGSVLFQQVIQSFGTEYYIFDNQMSIMTFILAGLFSIGFSMIINLLMIPKIKKIDMLASLKSVD